MFGIQISWAILTKQLPCCRHARKNTVNFLFRSFSFCFFLLSFPVAAMKSLLLLVCLLCKCRARAAFFSNLLHFQTQKVATCATLAAAAAAANATTTATTTAAATTTTSTSSGCQARHDNCYNCTDTTTCSFCENSHYLLNGSCVATCPSGYTGTGTGHFHRECVVAVSSTTASTNSTTTASGCQPRTENCHNCTNSTTCDMCENSHYLFDGSCVASCPSGYTSFGTGLFGRKCLIATSTKLRMQQWL